MLGNFSDQLGNLRPIAIAASGIEKIKEMPRLVWAPMLFPALD